MTAFAVWCCILADEFQVLHYFDMQKGCRIAASARFHKREQNIFIILYVFFVDGKD